jgi:hypothetical protein
MSFGLSGPSSLGDEQSTDGAAETTEEDVRTLLQAAGCCGGLNRTAPILESLAANIGDFHNCSTWNVVPNQGSARKFVIQKGCAIST